MSFHLGKPILVMVLVALLVGAGLLLRPGRGKRPDLVVWVFADIHQRTYCGDGSPAAQPSLVQQFSARHGKSVGVELIANRALNVRLTGLFMAATSGPELPDVVEVEVSQVGKYFRPPVADIGFLPLNDLLKQSGWYDRIVQSRFATWSKHGVIFGVPHDVHPVTISYRKDLFEEAGIRDLDSCRTWPQFHEKCLQAQAKWRQQGHRRRLAMELPPANSGYLNVMLLQRGINLIDDQERIHLNHPIVAETLAFYAQMVAGEKRIGDEGAAGDAVYSQDFAQGDLAAFFTADWRVASLKQYAPGLKGKMRMMALPVFDGKTDRPTSTYGGTMMGISRRCRDPQAAWKLVEHVYLSREGIEARRQHTDILPPVVEMWSDPFYQQPDEFYDGQPIGALYVKLAPQIPVRIVTPQTLAAESVLTLCLIKAAGHARSRGAEGLRQACQAWLDEGTKDLRRSIQQGRFD